MNYSEEIKKLIDQFNNKFNEITLQEATVESIPNMNGELASIESNVTDLYNGALNDGLDSNDPFFKQYNDFTEEIKNMKEQIEIELNYKSSVREYQALITEQRGLTLSGPRVSEIGLIELENLNTKYKDFDNRFKLYKDKINSIKLDPDRRTELLNRAARVEESVRKNLVFLDEHIKKKNETIKNLKNEEHDLINYIANINEKIKERQNLINQLAKDTKHNNQARIQVLQKDIEDLKAHKQNAINRLNDIGKNYEIIRNGGKLIPKNGPEKLDPIVNRDPQQKRPGQPQPKPGQPQQPQPGRPAPGRQGPKPQPPQPLTLESLRTSGKLPGTEFLSDKELLEICNKLNIDVKNPKAPFPQDKVDRLLQDRDIQVATLNASVQTKYQKKISQYDKLIAKYNKMINDHSKALSPEYQKKLKGYIATLEKERKAYTEEMKHLTVGEELGRGGLERRTGRKNDKLRQQYEKLDNLKEEKEMFSTNKMKKKYDKKIQKTLNKIAKLQTKKGKLADKQTKIVNKNSEKYIKEIEKRIDKYLKSRDKIVENVDDLQAIYDRIERLNKERDDIGKDLARLNGREQTLGTRLQRTGLRFDNSIKGKSVKRLGGKYGRVDRRMQRAVEKALNQVR